MNKKKILTLGLLCFSLVLSPLIYAKKYQKGEYTFSLKNTPNWVTRNDVSVDGSIKPNTESTYYLVDRQTNFIEKQHFYSRTVQRLNTPTGVENNSQLTFEFDPSYESLVVHAINIIRNGKTLNKLEPDTVVFVQQEKQLESLMYVGTISALFVLTDIRPGDVLDYSVSVIGSNPVFGEKFFSSVKLGWGVDVKKQYVKYRTPKGRPLNVKLIKSDTAIQTVHGKNYTDYIWQKNDISATYFEDAFPHEFQPVPLLLVSEYDNWKTVGEWAVPLYEQDKPLSKKLLSLIEHWKLSSPSKTEYAQNALRYMQDEIRYFGVEFGRNSHMPSHPNDVIERRFGDCKDKSITLATMLRKANIDASLALVSYNNRSGIKDLLPSPGVFDHVIVTAKIDGDVLWLDPTRTMQRGPLRFTPVTSFGKALVIDKANEGLTDVNPDSQQYSETVIKEVVTAADFWKPSTLKVTTVYSGRAAEYQRRRFADKNLVDISHQYFEYYSKLYTGITKIEELNYVDDEINNQFSTTETYEIPSFWQYDSEGAWFSAYGYGVKDYTSLPKALQRKMPLALNHSVQLKHQFTVEHSSSLNKFVALKPIVIEDDAVVFRRESSVKDNVYQVEFQYESKSHLVDVKKMPKHIASLRKINKVLDARPINRFEPDELHKIMLDRLVGDI